MIFVYQGGHCNPKVDYTVTERSQEVAVGPTGISDGRESVMIEKPWFFGTDKNDAKAQEEKTSLD